MGHGIGTSMHMDPSVPNYGQPGHGPKLVAGMALAIEPMVNLGGRHTRTLDDDWTVVTARRPLVGALRAHRGDHRRTGPGCSPRTTGERSAWPRSGVPTPAADPPDPHCQSATMARPRVTRRPGGVIPEFDGRDCVRGDAVAHFSH